MRVRRLSLVRLRDDQHGAVLMIVAICMIIMLGMLVLVFDLGRSVGIKRNMVNGADAAALAAATACATGQPFVNAQGAATTLVTDNNAQATLASFQADPLQCSGNPANLQQNVSDVKVTSSVPVEYFFAPIFGLNNGTVVASATAEWGPAIGVANPVPLRLTGEAAANCLAHLPGYEGTDCAFGFDNNDPQDPTSSNYGVLNFPGGFPPAPPQGTSTTGWPNPVDCSSNSGGQNNVIDYLSGTGPDFTPVLWSLPYPIYVCSDPGLGASTINWFIDWLNAHIGEGLIFPVMPKLCNPASSPCPNVGASPPEYPEIQSGGLAYPIVGFIKLTVRGAWKGHQAQVQCPSLPSHSANVFCVQLRRDDTTIVDGVPGNGAYYSQLKAVRLVG